MDDRTYPGEDHVPHVEAASPRGASRCSWSVRYVDDLVARTPDSLDGDPAGTTC